MIMQTIWGTPGVWMVVGRSLFENGHCLKKTIGNILTDQTNHWEIE